MERINLKNYKLPEQVKSKIQPWQEYALKVIDDFGITNEKMLVVDRNGKRRIVVKNFKAMIFRHACNNMSFLIGRVENAKEKFGEEGVKGKGNYLISLFRKKKPWDLT